MPKHTKVNIAVVTHKAQSVKQLLVQSFNDLHLTFIDPQDASSAPDYECDYLIVHGISLSAQNFSLKHKAQTVIYVPPVHHGNSLQSLVDVLADLRDSVSEPATVSLDVDAAKQPSKLDAIQVALGDIAQGFLRADSWHEYIMSAMGKLGLATQVDRVYLFENVIEQGMLRFYQRYEWVKSDVSPQINNPDLQGGDYTGFERWLEHLSNSQPIVGDVDTFPASEQAILGAQAIQSICIMPVIVEGALWGFIGFDSVAEKRVWTLLELETLRLVANVLAAAIQYELTASVLEQTENELRDILNRVDDVVYSIDLEGDKIIYLNRAVEDLTGYPLENFYSHSGYWSSLVHPDDREIVRPALRNLMDQQLGHQVVQYRIITQDGQTRWVEDRMYITYQDQQPVQVNGIVVDITAEKLAQRQAEQLTSHLNMVLDNIKSAVLLVAPDGEIIRYNRAFANGFGVKVPKTFMELLDSFSEIVLESQGFRERAIACLQDHQPVNQYEFTLLDGRVISCDYRPIVYDDHVEHLWHCRDITVYKQTMRDMQLALEREVQLNKLRNDFISMVSHEFRTPLSIINSSNETLLRYDGRLTGEQKFKRHQKIETQVRHMTAMLDDALSLGKMESSFGFAPQLISLGVLIGDILSDFRQTYQGYEIAYDCPDGGCEAEVDPKMFRQIIHNLMSNAIKYSDEGSQITVSLSCENSEIFLSVADQGIGIPDSDHGRIFQMFTRASNVQNIPGSGLGLVVVNNAVRRHNGSITFESEAQRGTRFIVRLPSRQIFAVNPIESEVMGHDHNTRNRG